jgi:hypothetical protein
MNLERLSDFFPPESIAWKPVATTKDKGKALAAAYITNHVIMDRLDEVCGPLGWCNMFQPGPDGGVLCGLSIRDPGTGEWVTKWDGAENTDVEPVKGGITSSMKRAAAMWGIGRYVSNIPNQWVPIDQYGKFTQEPRVPKAFLPKATRTPKAVPAPAADPDSRAFFDALEEAGQTVFGDGWPEARRRGCLKVSEGRAERPEDLSPDEAEALFELLESAAKAEQG